MKRYVSLSRFYIFLILVSVLVGACKTERVVSDVKIKPLSTDRIIKKIEGNAVDYRYFSVKRINCQFEDGGNRTTFKAILMAQKDESVMVSFNKLNIAVGRILLTPDSVKYINYLEKTYFVGDYSFLQKMFNINLDFNDIQAIVGNNIFSFSGDRPKNDFRDFTSFIDSGKYVVVSVKNKKVNKNRQIDNRRSDRMAKRINGGTSVVQTIVVNPGNFNIEKIKMEGQGNSDLVEFEFGDYTAFNSKDYPGSINMNFSSGAANINMKLRLAGFSNEKPGKTDFKIPEKYSRVVID